MNILINGASGFIGYHLIKEFLDNNHNVIAICRKISTPLESLMNNPHLNVIVCSQQELFSNICNLKVDVWFQLLWEGACGVLRSSPNVQINNELLAIMAMEVAHAINCKKIIYSGTVYENISDKLLADHSFNKNSFYIISKKHTHEITYQLSKGYNMSYIWCQFCHPIGKFMNKGQLIPYAINSFINNYNVEFGKCDQWYDIIPVKNLAVAFRLLAEKETKSNFYYLGSNKPKILKDYILEVAKICNYKNDIVFGLKQNDGLVYKKDWFNASRFTSEFSFSEIESFEDAVSEIIAELKVLK